MDDDWGNDDWDPYQSSDGSKLNVKLGTSKKEERKRDRLEEIPKKPSKNDSITSLKNPSSSVSDILAEMFPDQWSNVQKTSIESFAESVDNGSVFTNSTDVSKSCSNNQTSLNGKESEDVQYRSPGNTLMGHESVTMGIQDGVNHGFCKGLTYAIQLLSEVLDRTVHNGIDPVAMSAETGSRHYSVNVEMSYISKTPSSSSIKPNELFNSLHGTSESRRQSFTTSTPATTPVLAKKLYTPEEDNELIRIAKEIRQDDPDISDHKLFGLVFEKLGGTRSRHSIASHMQRKLADKWKL